MKVQRLHILAPSAVSLLAGALGLAGAAALPTSTATAALLLALSVLLDCVDGALARRLGACTEFGRRLDLALDGCVAAAVLVTSGLLPLVPLLAVVQAAAGTCGRRVSGRTGAVILGLLTGGA